MDTPPRLCHGAARRVRLPISHLALKTNTLPPPPRYESNMIDIMYSLRPHRGAPLTELEVFSGSILGKKDRSSTRAIREANKEVQERFDRDVSAIARRIARGYDDGDAYEDDAEALPRAVACFKVALETEGWENEVVLRSWKYVAASVCLEQLNVYRLGRLRAL